MSSPEVLKISMFGSLKVYVPTFEEFFQATVVTTTDVCLGKNVDRYHHLRQGKTT